MIGNTPETLRALVANDDRARLARVAAIVSGLGFDVVAEEVDGVAAAATAVRTNPDLAIVALGSDPDHAFELIQRIAREGACPVIALLDATNEGFVREAARRGIFAYIDSDSPERWRSAIEIVLRRFTDYENLKGALERRAVTERAKGILMERHQIDENEAFELIRARSRNANRKLVDIAQSILDGHMLLPTQP